MISIGLIVPTWHYFNDPFKLQPLNELYFATVLDEAFQHAIDVQVIDLRVIRKTNQMISDSNIKSIISEMDIYLYWVAKTADFPEVMSIVESLRNIYPKSKHVAGGTHVQVFKNESSKVFDAIVVGPGEESFKTVINDFSKSNLETLYYSDWDTIQYSSYPFTRRHYLPKQDIVNKELFKMYGEVNGTSAMFSRGCNFRCAYCVYNVPNKIQLRTPNQIKEEILYLKKEYAIQGVNLRDEICLPLSPEVAIPYIEAIGSTNVIWRGQTRVGAPFNLIKLAKESGCVELALGVESVSQNVLNIINKGQTITQVKECISYCKKTGIKIKMCLIMGLPGEPFDILKQTIAFINETEPDYVNVSGFCPIPGSPIFQDKDKYDIEWISEDWNRHAHLMFRFSDEEHFGLPFKYKDRCDWGNSFSNEQILDNIRKLQIYLRNRGMSY